MNNIDNVTLHVPDVALHAYAGTHPWNEFGTIMGFSGATEEPYTGFQPVSATDNKGDVHEVARYSIDGKLLTRPQKGINIIKMSDGTTKKVRQK